MGNNDKLFVLLNMFLENNFDNLQVRLLYVE